MGLVPDLPILPSCFHFTIQFLATGRLLNGKESNAQNNSKQQILGSVLFALFIYD